MGHRIGQIAGGTGAHEALAGDVVVFADHAACLPRAAG